MNWKPRDLTLFLCFSLFILLAWILAPGFIDRDVIHLHADNIARGEVNLWYSYSYSKIALFFWLLTNGVEGLYYFQALFLGLFSFVTIFLLYKKHDKYWVTIFSLIYLFFFPTSIGFIFLPVRDVLYVTLVAILGVYPIFLSSIKNKSLGLFLFLIFLGIAILTMDLKQQSVGFFIGYFLVLLNFSFFSKRRTATLAICALAFAIIRFASGYPWIPPDPIYSAPGKVVFLNYLTKHGVTFTEKNRRNLDPFYELDRLSTIKLDVGHPPFSLGGIRTEDLDVYETFSKEVNQLILEYPFKYISFRFKVVSMLNGWWIPFKYFWDWTSLKEPSRDEKLLRAKIDVHSFHPYREKIKSLLNVALSPSFLSPIIFSTFLPFLLMFVLFRKSFKGSKLRFFVLTQCLQAPTIWLVAPMPMFRYTFSIFLAAVISLHIYYHEKQSLSS